MRLVRIGHAGAWSTISGSALRLRGARVLAAACGALLLASCAASRQYFEPTERVQGQTQSGYKQALYPLIGPQGVFGEAMVWSRGAYRTSDGRTVVQIAFTLHNLSDAPIVLSGSDVVIDGVQADGAMVPTLAPSDPSELQVAPEQFGQVQLHFVMPADLDPGDIDGFRLQWAVQRGPVLYRQRTLFTERPPRAAHPGYGYYGPGYLYGGPGCWPYSSFGCFYGSYWGPYPPYPPYPIAPPPGGGRPDRTVVRPRR